MLNRWWKTGVAIVAIVALVAGYRWWPSDERAIAAQLSTIATTLSGTTGSDGFGALARMAALRKALAPDIHVSAGPAPAEAGLGTDRPLEVAGRDQALALVSRWTPPPGGMTVAFIDEHITVAEDRTHGQVYCTATITSRAATGEPNIDARELTIGLTKIDGGWVVQSVQAEDTLTR